MAFNQEHRGAFMNVPTWGTISKWALAFYVFTIPWEAGVVLPALGSIARLAGVLVLCFATGQVLIKKRVRKLDALHYWMFAFLLWTTSSYFWTTNDSLTLGRLVFYYQAAAMMWGVWELTTSERDINRLVQAYVIGSVIACLSVFYNGVHGNAYALSYSDSRFSAFNTDPNEMSLMLSIAVPFAWRSFMRSANLLKVLNLAYIVAAISAILLTSSRGGFISVILSLGIVVATFTRLNAYSKILTVLGVCAGLVAVIVVVPHSSWVRILTIGGQVSSGTLNGRVTIWHDGWVAYLLHPFTGVGAGAYPAAIQDTYGIPKVAHDTYISVLVEDGLVGFTLFAGMLFRAFQSVYRVSGVDRIMWLNSLLVWVVGVTTLTWDDRKVTWLLLTLAVASYGISRRPRNSGPLHSEIGDNNYRSNHYGKDSLGHRI